MKTLVLMRADSCVLTPDGAPVGACTATNLDGCLVRLTRVATFSAVPDAMEPLLWSLAHALNGDDLAAYHVGSLVDRSCGGDGRPHFYYDVQ